MNDVDAFWRMATSWTPPFSDRMRQFSVLPLLTLPIVVSSTPVGIPARLVLGLGVVFCGYIILSALMYLVLRSGPRYFQNVEVGSDHLGWFADTVSEAGEHLDIDKWHFSATTQHGPGTLTPGGAALALFPNQAVPAAIVMMSHHEKPSPQVDFRFVSIRNDGTLLSTGNTPPPLPMSGLDQQFDRVADARLLWEEHCELLDGSARCAELSEIVELMSPPGDQINPIRQAGFIRFILNWAPNAWRRSGLTRALPSVAPPARR